MEASISTIRGMTCAALLIQASARGRGNTHPLCVKLIELALPDQFGLFSTPVLTGCALP